MNLKTLAWRIKSYAIDPNCLRSFGFPTASNYHPGCVEIYKTIPKPLDEEDISSDESFDGLMPAWYFTPEGVHQIYVDIPKSYRKQCVRCSKIFAVNENGVYLSSGTCTFHPGKLKKVYNGKCYTSIYSCCQGEKNSKGCSVHRLHVWNGVVDGLNGPYGGFMYTQRPRENYQHYVNVYALDCEMCYTGLGLELAKVTVIGIDGSIVYEQIVLPQAPIVDYNTTFSGISEKDFLPHPGRCIKTLPEVQRDLLNFIDSETVIIGHGLENDLKALRLVHKTIVDTALIFEHPNGFPYRHSLKNLTKTYLKREIQRSDMGHNSYEDALACLELMEFKVQMDFPESISDNTVMVFRI